jgi:putative hydrolase of the HAD superfamily
MWTRAVLFDLFNTLVDGGSDAERTALSERMGADVGVDPAAFARLMHQTWPQRFRGELGDLAGTVRAIAVRLGGHPSEAAVRRAAGRRIDFTRRLLRPPASTLATLDALRAKGIPLGLATNCSAETPRLWRDTPLAERFAATGFSCVLGVCKPEPEIYLAVCASLGVPPGDCVFVGDGEAGELAGAAALGMRAIQVTEWANSAPTWSGERIGELARVRRCLD